MHSVSYLLLQINQNQIKDEELLEIPPQTPAPTVNLLNDLMAAAAEKIQSSIQAQEMTELEIEDCIKLSDQLYRGTKFTSIGAKVAVYTNLCHINGVQLPGKTTKLQMFNLLGASVCATCSTLSLTNSMIRLKQNKNNYLKKLW